VAGLIALDADGVLLNYHEAYAQAWARAFGTRPLLADPLAYWPQDRWGVPVLALDARQRLKAEMQEEFWTTMPALDGAIEACKRLVAAGHDLICVSALRPQFASARLENIRRLGFPIDRVIAAPLASNQTASPKAKALSDLRPAAFVDDYLPYLKGVPETIHRALVMRQPNGSPNSGEDMVLADSTHADLRDFADWWLRR
jgi:phosphoglycolate phosphatase-like HAD superfamily hydrolase